MPSGGIVKREWKPSGLPISLLGAARAKVGDPHARARESAPRSRAAARRYLKTHGERPFFFCPCNIDIICF